MTLLLEKPISYFISKGDADSANFELEKATILGRIRSAGEAGISIIQIREKDLTARLLLELTEAAVAITKNFHAKVLVNGRADIALAAGADGVHLPADGLPASVIRANFPPGFLIGVSTHSAEEARDARSNGADFVTFGPVFESPGKGAVQGIEMLSSVCHLLDPFPVIALGGIDDSNFRDVLESGAAGFAAIRFLNNERKLRKIIEK